MVKYSQFQFHLNNAYSINFHENCIVSTNIRPTQSAHTACGLKHILACVVLMKLHPQEVLAGNHGHGIHNQD